MSKLRTKIEYNLKEDTYTVTSQVKEEKVKEVRFRRVKLSYLCGLEFPKPNLISVSCLL